jgi:hypothetical protein
MKTTALVLLGAAAAGIALVVSAAAIELSDEPPPGPPQFQTNDNPGFRPPQSPVMTMEEFFKRTGITPPRTQRLELEYPEEDRQQYIDRPRPR